MILPQQHVAIPRCRHFMPASLASRRVGTRESLFSASLGNDCLAHDLYRIIHQRIADGV